MTELRLRNIDVNLPSGRVLSDVNLDARAGEITLLYGDNGTGKTSLIRVISGLNTHYSGDIEMHNESIDIDNHISVVRKRSSILLTVPVRPAGMRVREFLGLYEEERNDTLYSELVELFSVAKLMNSYMDSISDGERQKVLLVKVLSKNVDLIILDEPSTFIDFRSREKLYEFISERLMKLGKAILLSTHDLHNAREHLSNSYHVIEGKVSETGTVLENFDDFAK